MATAINVGLESAFRAFDVDEISYEHCHKTNDVFIMADQDLTLFQTSFDNVARFLNLSVDEAAQRYLEYYDVFSEALSDCSFAGVPERLKTITDEDFFVDDNGKYWFARELKGITLESIIKNHLLSNNQSFNESFYKQLELTNKNSLNPKVIHVRGRLRSRLYFNNAGYYDDYPFSLPHNLLGKAVKHYQTKTTNLFAEDEFLSGSKKQLKLLDLDYESCEDNSTCLNIADLRPRNIAFENIDGKPFIWFFDLDCALNSRALDQSYFLRGNQVAYFIDLINPSKHKKFRSSYDYYISLIHSLAVSFEQSFFMGLNEDGHFLNDTNNLFNKFKASTWLKSLNKETNYLAKMTSEMTTPYNLMYNDKLNYANFDGFVKLSEEKVIDKEGGLELRQFGKCKYIINPVSYRAVPVNQLMGHELNSDDKRFIRSFSEYSFGANNEDRFNNLLNETINKDFLKLVNRFAPRFLE